MGMKITGAEWREFEANGWPAGYIWADESTLDDERELYAMDGSLGFAADETFIVPAEWRMIYEGPEGKNLGGEFGLNIRAVIRKWRKDRDSETLVVTVPKSSAGEARSLLASHGWKIA